MVPQRLGQEPIDGVYWTLTFELMFYLVIFVTLFLGLKRWLPAIFVAWALLMLAVTLVGIDDIPLLGGYFSYFVGGALLDLIRRLGATPLRIAGVISAVAVSTLFTFERVEGWGTVDLKLSDVMIRGALNLACFGTVALALIPAVASLSVPGSRLMGALTYPIYLLHAHIGYVVLNNFATRENVWLVLAAMSLGLVATAWVLHEVIEVRMAMMWRRLFGTLVERPTDRAQRLLPWLAPSRTGAP